MSEDQRKREQDHLVFLWQHSDSLGDGCIEVLKVWLRLKEMRVKVLKHCVVGGIRAEACLDEIPDDKPKV